MRKQVYVAIRDTFRDCSRLSRVSICHVTETATCLVVISVQNGACLIKVVLYYFQLYLKQNNFLNRLVFNMSR